MNDYSKYIKKEFGFITNIETNIEKNTIEITLSKSKKGQPHVYELNQENVEKFYQRLENQYRLLIENKDKILEDITKETVKKFSWIFKSGVGILTITLIVTIISFFIKISLLLMISQLIGLITGSTLIYSTNKIVDKKEQSFNKALDSYKYYLEKREEIEKMIKKDDNILSYLDTKTNEQIQNNQKLIDKNLTHELFDIQFMDKVSLEQLKAMLERYQISKSLEETQYFHIEEEPVKEKKSKVKNKTKTKKQ